MTLVVFDEKAAMNSDSLIKEDAAEVVSGERYVGLSNQGATCYLNGLLQTLYMTPEFRRAMFQWNYDKEKHGDEQFCIPLQLQKLFGFMMLSKQRAIDTLSLTKSFGWEGSEAFQQQDVQELTRVLFDALEESFKGTPSEKILDKLYTGQTVSYLRCIEVDYESEKVEKFQDLSMAIVNPFGDDAPCNSLKECIETYLQPEILDGDNKYYVEDFDQKATTMKGLKFLYLPRLLSLHLKRFVMDFTSYNMSTKKINDVVSFPMVLDMNKYIAKRKEERKEVVPTRRRTSSSSSSVSATSNNSNSNGNSRSRKSSASESEMLDPLNTSGNSHCSSTGDLSGSGKLRDSFGTEAFEEFTSGWSSNGNSNSNGNGHGFSSSGGLRPLPDSDVDFDGSEREFEEGEEFEVFLQQQLARVKAEMERKEKAADATADAEGDVPAVAVAATVASDAELDNVTDLDDPDAEAEAVSVAEGGEEEEEEEGEEEQLEYGTEDIPRLLRTRGQWVYELYAVLIHSGSVNGGHYYAYIKDLDSQQWWNFNDSSVTRIDEQTVKTAWGTANSAGRAATAMAGPTVATGDGWSHYGGVGGGSTSSFSTSTASTTSFSSTNAYMLQYRKVANELVGEKVVTLPKQERVPAYVREMVNTMEVELERKQSEERERLNKLNLSVHYGDKPSTKVACKKNQTLKEALVTIRDALLSSNISSNINKTAEDDNDAAAASGAAPEPIPLQRLRLRDYSLHTKMATVVHDIETKGDKLLSAMAFYDHKHVILEVREEGEEWEPWYEHGVTISAHVYHAEADKIIHHTLRLPRDATSEDLRTRVIPLLPATVDAARVRVYKIIERYSAGAAGGGGQTCTGELLPVGGDKKLKEGLGLYDSTKVFVDEAPPLPDTDRSSIDGTGGMGSYAAAALQPASAPSSDTLTKDNCPAIACYVESKNRVTIKLNLPPNSVNNIPLAINLGDDIETLRTAVVAKLNEIGGATAPFTVEKTRLFKTSAHGVELKLGDDSPLAKLHICDSMSIVVQRGVPSWIGQYRLKVALFEPRDWNTMQWGIREAPYSAGDAGAGAHSDNSSAAGTSGDTPLRDIYAENAALFQPSKTDEDVVAMALAVPISGNEDIDDAAFDGGGDATIMRSAPSLAAAAAAVDSLKDDMNGLSISAAAVAATTATDAADASLSSAVMYGPTGAAFGQASTNYITGPTDFYNTDIVVSVGNGTKVETLRQVLYDRMRDDGIFSSEFGADKADDAGDAAGGSTSTTTGIFKLDGDSTDTDTATTTATQQQKGGKEKGRYSHVTGPEYIRIRSHTTGHQPPGAILRDGLSLLDAKLTLFNDKVLVVQVLSTPDRQLPPMEAGDVVVLVQRWHRTSWALGTRLEVLLRGSRTVRSVVGGIASLLGISDVSCLRVFKLNKLGADVYLSQLKDAEPASSSYNYVSWVDPCAANGDKELKSAREFSLADGDLLIVQDTSEPLRELSQEESRSVAFVTEGGPPEYASMEVTGSSYLGGNNMPAGASGPTQYKPWHSSSSSSSSTGSAKKPAATALRREEGVKIKKHSDRLKEEKVKEDAASASANGSGGGGVTSTAADNAEFSKSGGFALFEDLA